MSEHGREAFPAARRDIADARRLRDECAEWLEGYEWHHVVALTCKLPLTAPRLRIAFEHEFHRRLTRVAQRDLRWFLVIEGGDDADVRTHAHCLLYGTAALACDKIATCWHRGLTSVTRFVPNGGAARYLASKLPAHPDGWVFSDRMPPLRSARRRAA